MRRLKLEENLSDAELRALIDSRGSAPGVLDPPGVLTSPNGHTGVEAAPRDPRPVTGGGDDPPQPLEGDGDHLPERDWVKLVLGLLLIAAGVRAVWLGVEIMRREVELPHWFTGGF